MKFVYSVWCALALCGCSEECLRVLQSASYRPRRGYFKILLSPYFGALAVLCAFSWVWKIYFPLEELLCAVYMLFALVVIMLPRKSALKLTKRMWRILIAEFFLLCISCVVALHWWTLFLPLFSLAAWLICLPIDATLNKKYLKSARKKLDDSGATVIAITGSFGKTSTKEMLCALLDGAVSPAGSCNTPLGIAAYVNNVMPKRAKYLVLEFGARQKGDIAQLCKLFSPTFGIVTGVCAQHLSTFKSLENIRSAKRELVECLPRKGFCLLCDESVRDFSEVGVCRKIIQPQVDISNMQILPNGLQFDVKCAVADSEKLCVTDYVCCAKSAHKTDNYNTAQICEQVYLPQITPHSAATFAFCATMCLLLGQSLAQTIKNAARVKQAAHRMEISNNGKFYIIDDSYNANIRGVESCCDVLRKFDGTKAVISQGIVEGGKEQRALNVRCGKLLGEVCNVVIVLGKNAKWLRDGISETNSAEAAEKCTILSAKTLRQAVSLAQPFLKNGGFLVFQNDLPDVINI